MISSFVSSVLIPSPDISKLSSRSLIFVLNLSWMYFLLLSKFPNNARAWFGSFICILLLILIPPIVYCPNIIPFLGKFFSFWWADDFCCDHGLAELLFLFEGLFLSSDFFITFIFESIDPVHFSFRFCFSLFFLF